MKKVKNVISILVVLNLLFNTAMFVFADMENEENSMISSSSFFKDETVYVNLKNDGNAENITMVNHIYKNEYDQSENLCFIDYGKYNNVTLLNRDIEYTKEDERLIFLSDALEEDIYYQAYIDKDLPVDIKIHYYLDGKKVNAQELAGKTGELEVEIEIINLSKERFMAQVSLEINMDIFNDIHDKDATTVVVGKTKKINYTLIPDPASKINIKMYGRKIEFEPVNITLIPYSSNMAASFLDGLDELKNGLAELSENYDKVTDGSEELLNNIGDFNSGIINLMDGAYELKNALAEINLQGDNLTEGIDALSNGLSKCKDNVLIIKNGILLMQQGNYSLNQALSGIDTGIAELNSSHTELTALAQNLLGKYDESSPEYMLLSGLIKEQAAISKLNSAFDEVSAAAVNMADSSGQLSEGIEQITMGVSELNNGAEALQDGWSTYSSAAEKTGEGMESLYNGITKLYEGSEKIYDGNCKLNNGITDFKNEGIDKIYNEVTEQININEEDSKYTSFSDERNKYSKVQFLMKTEKISIEKNEEDNLTVKEKKSIWERLMDLFR